MTLLIIGIVCFLIGGIGLLAFNAISAEAIKSSANMNFLNFFVKNGTKNIFATQLLCGLIIIIINGSSLNNQIEKLYPRTQNDEFKGNQQQESKINSTEVENNNQTTNTQENPVENNENICAICERKFQGDGYCKGDDGNWRLCEYPYSGSICSVRCGKTSDKNLIDAASDLINAQKEGQRCKWCGMGYYRNGACTRCGTVPKEVQEIHNLNAPKCFLCNGTGIERPMGRNINGETGRICPACNGKGIETH